MENSYWESLQSQSSHRCWCCLGTGLVASSVDCDSRAARTQPRRASLCGGVMESLCSSASTTETIETAEKSYHRLSSLLLLLLLLLLLRLRRRGQSAVTAITCLRVARLGLGGVALAVCVLLMLMLHAFTLHAFTLHASILSHFLSPLYILFGQQNVSSFGLLCDIRQKQRTIPARSSPLSPLLPPLSQSPSPSTADQTKTIQRCHQFLDSSSVLEGSSSPNSLPTVNTALQAVYFGPRTNHGSPPSSNACPSSPISPSLSSLSSVPLTPHIFSPPFFF